MGPDCRHPGLNCPQLYTPAVSKHIFLVKQGTQCFVFCFFWGLHVDMGGGQIFCHGNGARHVISRISEQSSFSNLIPDLTQRIQKQLDCLFSCPPPPGQLTCLLPPQLHHSTTTKCQNLVEGRLFFSPVPSTTHPQHSFQVFGRC